jgi:predicted phosphodiesterase
MKALIISDVHSNIYALQAVWNKENDSDVVYCAGDLVDYGPFPQEVIRWIRDRNIVCVKGNHDEDIVRTFRSGVGLSDVPEQERTWAMYNADRLDEDEINFLNNLPEHVSFNLDGFHYCILLC